MTIRCYLRVSTLDQQTDSQRLTIERWLRSQDAPNVVWYDQDAGYSRLTAKGRPGWAQLQTDLEPGDVVVFAQLDRAVADVSEYMAIRNEFRLRKVGYWYVRENMGWKPGEEANPFVEALEEILAIFGKLETRIRQARQLAGIRSAKEKVANNEERRTRSGRVVTNYGSGRKPGTRIKVTEEKEQAARQMVEQGKSKSEIARVLGISRKHLYTILGNGD